MTKFHIKDITAEFYNEDKFNNDIKIAFDAKVSLYTAKQKSPQEFEKQLNMIRNEDEEIHNIFVYDILLYKLLETDHYDLLLDKKVQLYINFEEVDIYTMLDAVSKRYCELFEKQQFEKFGESNLDLTLEGIAKYSKRELNDSLNAYKHARDNAPVNYKLDNLKKDEPHLKLTDYLDNGVVVKSEIKQYIERD